MSIPFKLNYLKQIEIYQDLNELDKQFLEQLRDPFRKTLPLWFFEKKILHWAYIGHKHLGSPIRIKYFDFNEIDYGYIRESSFDKIAEDVKKEIPMVERNLEYIQSNLQEIQQVSIRKVFGNLEVRGYAKFFKEDQENYWKINQSNCDGILLTPKGLECARMIYFSYEYKEAQNEYKEIKGVKKVLIMKGKEKVKFSLYIVIAGVIIWSSVFLFFKTLIEQIIELSD